MFYMQHISVFVCDQYRYNTLSLSLSFFLSLSLSLSLSPPPSPLPHPSKYKWLSSLSIYDSMNIVCITPFPLRQKTKLFKHVNIANKITGTTFCVGCCFIRRQIEYTQYCALVILLWAYIPVT